MSTLVTIAFNPWHPQSHIILILIPSKLVPSINLKVDAIKNPFAKNFVEFAHIYAFLVMKMRLRNHFQASHATMHVQGQQRHKAHKSMRLVNFCVDLGQWSKYITQQLLFMIIEKGDDWWAKDGSFHMGSWVMMTQKKVEDIIQRTSTSKEENPNINSRLVGQFCPFGCIWR